MSLPAAPSSPLRKGEPLYGTYSGCCESTALDHGSRRDSLRREKHWQYFAVADESIAVGGAIVDATLFATAFCWVLERSTGRLIADHSRLLPGLAVSLSETPHRGTVARTRGLRRSVQISRRDATVRIDGRMGPVDLALTIEAPPERAVTAVCPVTDGPGPNVTQKEVSVAAGGTVTVDGRTHRIEDGLALLDHTHGLLARTTSWRWGFGVGRRDGEPVGFNLVSEFNDGLENACWLDGTTEALSPATLETEPWRLSADAVDLELAVEGERREDVDAGLLSSRYRQPIGTWSGEIRGLEVEEWFGVAEVHESRW